jgi:hypothetical protein
MAHDALAKSRREVLRGSDRDGSTRPSKQPEEEADDAALAAVPAVDYNHSRHACGRSEIDLQPRVVLRDVRVAHGQRRTRASRDVGAVVLLAVNAPVRRETTVAVRARHCGFERNNVLPLTVVNHDVGCAHVSDD